MDALLWIGFPHTQGCFVAEAVWTYVCLLLLSSSTWLAGLVSLAGWLSDWLGWLGWLGLALGRAVRLGLVGRASWLGWAGWAGLAAQAVLAALVGLTCWLARCLTS